MFYVRRHWVHTQISGRRKTRDPRLVWLVLLLVLALRLVSCQGLPKYVANCPITPTVPVIEPTATPAPVPPMAALCPFPMTVSPANGATVQSPINVIVNTQPAITIYNTRVYVDDVAVYFTFLGAFNQYIWVPNGNHVIEVVSEDQSGYISTQKINVNVTGQDTTGIGNIQNMPGWTNCSSVLVTGAVCAAGLGTAKSALEQGQSTPSVSGAASAQFRLEGGTKPYSNALYWIPLGGGANVSHFSYDLWFYIDNGDASQALEFDVNQTFGGTRWTWGSECNFNADAKWDIWDDAGGVWVPTDIPCKHFPSNTWVHLIWNLERVGNQVHYISLTVADQTYKVDTYYTAQSQWYADEIDVAFQMDGNWQQQPYSVWLDQVTLTAY